MASTNSTVDGMGFEEVNQEVTSTYIISGTHIYGTTVDALLISGDDIYANTNVVAARVYGDEYVSGLVIFGTNISGANYYEDSKGKLHSASIQNATELYGYRIRAGSVKTADSNSGLVVFTGSFTTANWFMTITPRDLTNPYKYIDDQSGAVPMVSGLRRASGCWIIGGSQTVFDYIAVGI